MGTIPKTLGPTDWPKRATQTNINGVTEGRLMSKVNTQHLAQLIERIGGKENITTVSHCLTRLRFVLADPAKADP